jgi:hypothetical protein
MTPSNDHPLPFRLASLPPRRSATGHGQPVRGYPDFNLMDEDAQYRALDDLLRAIRAGGNYDRLLHKLGEEAHDSRLDVESVRKKQGLPNAFESLPAVRETYAMIERDRIEAGAV